jgi:hypothetical protein
MRNHLPYDTASYPGRMDTSSNSCEDLKFCLCSGVLGCDKPLSIVSEITTRKKISAGKYSCRKAVYVSEMQVNYSKRNLYIFHKDLQI